MKKSSGSSFAVTGGVILFFLALAGILVYLVSSDKGGGKKTFIAKVELVRPNIDKPPPPPKEKLPEPEVQKKVFEAVRMDTQAQAPTAKGDNKPAPEGPLGLEGEGGAGSDAFGLAARGKGGRDVITLGTGPGGPGGLDGAVLARKFAWYTRLIQEELKKTALKRLEESGTFPKGRQTVEVRVVIDDGGTVTECQVTGSSGNRAVDKAVRESLEHAKVSERPPADLPRRMTFKITSRG
jgi:TonB family protein